MNPPDQASAAPVFELAVFEEPWQASAFAMTVSLYEQGLFTWSEWASSLAAVIANPESADLSYYRQWLMALEHLLAAKGITTTREVDALEQAWHRAAEATPHGQPIRLEVGLDVSAGH